MEYLIHTLLDQSKARYILEDLLKSDSDWQDGKKSAGSFAAEVKRNLQLNKASQKSLKNSQEIRDLIEKDELLKSFCLPKSIHGVMFSCASKGDGYGTHVDNAYMSSGRSDLSFTLFLSEPDDYLGGELCIQNIQDSQKIKLSAGQIVIYPSTSLHSVKTITKGHRVVCVGWIESYIASNEDRSLLFSLDAGARGLLAKHGKSEQLDLIFQSYNNLLRRLGS